MGARAAVQFRSQDNKMRTLYVGQVRWLRDRRSGERVCVDSDSAVEFLPRIVILENYHLFVERPDSEKKQNLNVWEDNIHHNHTQ